MLFVTDIVKPERPRVTICLTRLSFNLKFSLFSFSIVFLPARNRSTHTEEINWEMTVARAAPLTPRCRTKMKTGSNIIFKTAPIKTVSMPVLAKP